MWSIFIGCSNGNVGCLDVSEGEIRTGEVRIGQIMYMCNSGNVNKKLKKNSLTKS